MTATPDADVTIDVGWTDVEVRDGHAGPETKVVRPHVHRRLYRKGLVTKHLLCDGLRARGRRRVGAQILRAVVGAPSFEGLGGARAVRGLVDVARSQVRPPTS